MQQAWWNVVLEEALLGDHDDDNNDYCLTIRNNRQDVMMMMMMMMRMTMMMTMTMTRKGHLSFQRQPVQLHFFTCDDESIDKSPQKSSFGVSQPSGLQPRMQGGQKLAFGLR